MLENYIKIVQEELAYFDEIIVNNKGDSRIQAKFWTRRYNFEQLLAYLLGQQKKPNKPSSNALGPRKKTAELENSIFNFVKNQKGEVSVLKIKGHLKSNDNLDISNSALSNRLWIMTHNRGLLENVKRGFYKTKVEIYDEKSPS